MLSACSQPAGNDHPPVTQNENPGDETVSPPSPSTPNPGVTPPDGQPGDDPGDTGPAHEPAELPGELLDLTPWKITLPVANDEGGPLEITQPQLDTYEIDPWFVVDGDVVRFRANAGGVTTSGSSYPRSELREMTADGAERASWSTSSGIHTMEITQAITHLPEVKPHAVAGQIHDAADDVVMIRLEGTRLFVEGGGVDLGVLDADYQLGEVFTTRIVATEGRIDVYHDDMTAPAVSVPADTDGCYFKAGVYTQSNESRGDTADAYAEVEMHDLVVTHQ